MILTDTEWKKMNNNKRKGRNNKNNEVEELLKESEVETYDLIDLHAECLEEEIELVNAKLSGHKRTGPQESPEIVTKASEMFNCDQCGSELESKGLLKAHLASHVVNLLFD